jgi:hypothetical protein
MSLKKSAAGAALLALSLGAAPANAERHGQAHQPGTARAVTVAPRTMTIPRATTRHDTLAPRSNPVATARTVPRIIAAPRHVGVSRPFVPVRLYRPFYRPYYIFRPHYNLGFGLFVGDAVPYPYAYVVPSPYPVYGYPAVPAYGGVSFDVTPSNAAVYVDGNYVGIVSDFSPTAAPLTLVPGPHYIDVEAPDCQPMTFDVNVMAGEVIPYQGVMLPS